MNLQTLYYGLGIVGTVLGLGAGAVGFFLRRHKEIILRLDLTEKMAEQNRASLANGSGRFSTVEDRISRLEETAIVVREMKVEFAGMKATVERIEQMLFQWFKRNPSVDN